MAASITNTKFYQSPSVTTSHNPSLGFTATAGRLLVAIASLDAASVSSFTDNLTGTWTSKANPVNWAGTFFRSKVAAGGETSMTISTGTNTGLVLAVFELDGTTGDNVTDGASSTTGTGGTMATPTVATAHAADYIFVVWATAATAGTWSSLSDGGGAAWTPVQRDNSQATANDGSKIQQFVASAEVSATGSYKGSLTFSGSVGLGAAIVAYEVAAGGGGPTVTYPELERRERGVSRGVSLGVG